MNSARPYYHPDHLLNVVSNLLSNAVKFTPGRGGGQVGSGSQQSERLHSLFPFRLPAFCSSRQGHWHSIPEEKLPFYLRPLLPGR